MTHTLESCTREPPARVYVQTYVKIQYTPPKVNEREMWEEIDTKQSDAAAPAGATLYLPATQSVQTADARAAHCPAAQSRHRLARSALAVARYFPVGQSCSRHTC